jgi:hypothetical protein
MVARPGPRATGLCIAAIAAIAPTGALACPYCAGRERGGIATNIILASFVFLPFVLAWAIYRIVRAEQSATTAETSAYTRSRRKA